MAGRVVENAITGEVVFNTAEQAPLETQTVESLKLRLAEFCGGGSIIVSSCSLKAKNLTCWRTSMIWLL